MQIEIVIIEKVLVSMFSFTVNVNYVKLFMDWIIKNINLLN